MYYKIIYTDFNLNGKKIDGLEIIKKFPSKVAFENWKRNFEETKHCYVTEFQILEKIDILELEDI